MEKEADDNNINGTIILPDLNHVVSPDEVMINDLAIIPFQSTLTNQEDYELTLFGINLNDPPTMGRELFPVLSPNLLEGEINVHEDELIRFPGKHVVGMGQHVESWGYFV